MTADRHDHGGDDCREMAARLSEYIDGELPESFCRRIEEHFEGCEPCQEFLQSIRNTVDWIRADPRPLMPASMRERLERALREAREREG